VKIVVFGVRARERCTTIIVRSAENVVVGNDVFEPEVLNTLHERLQCTDVGTDRRRRQDRTAQHERRVVSSVPIMGTTRANPDAVMPHLKIRARDVPQRMLVVGDPARAERTAALLDAATELSRNREYVMFAGSWNGEPVGVTSHGVGTAGAGICFEELCRSGVRRIIRAGTAGGMQPDIPEGSLVIATGAVRDEGLTPRLVPLAFPAVATRHVVAALAESARNRGVHTHEGIVVASDMFYPASVLGSDLEMWQRADVKAVEMECSGLFIIAHLYGIEAGAILATDGNPLAHRDESMSGFNPHRPVVDEAVRNMLNIALDAVARPL
jgi:uridine phosphorylase